LPALTQEGSPVPLQLLLLERAQRAVTSTSVCAARTARNGLKQLRTFLDEAGIRHVFYESPNTDHERQTWRRDLKDFAPRTPE
jgi:enterochelin esterase-like enzyme